MAIGDEFPVFLDGKEVGIAREIRDGIADIIITDNQAVIDRIRGYRMRGYRMHSFSIVEKDKGIGNIELV